MNKKVATFSMICILLFVGAVIVNVNDYFSPKTDVEPQADGQNNTEDFYTMTEIPEFTEMLMPEKMDELIDGTDLIFTGEIVSSTKPEASVETEANSAESALEEKGKRRDLKSDTPKKIINEINVLETIYGEAYSETIILNQSDIFIDYEPSLQEGDQLVLFLHKQKTTDEYVSVHPYASYYYLDSEQAVHPVYDTADFVKYENMSLVDFKKEIHSIMD